MRDGLPARREPMKKGGRPGGARPLLFLLDSTQAASDPTPPAAEGSQLQVPWWRQSWTSRGTSSQWMGPMISPEPTDTESGGAPGSTDTAL